jgi:hypothetical protein
MPLVVADCRAVPAIKDWLDFPAARLGVMHIDMMAYEA